MSQTPSLQYNANAMLQPMNSNEHTVSTNELIAETAGVKIDNFKWLDSSRMVDKVKGLKDLCIGNCRLLYGSERFKFYGTKDVVICNDEKSNLYCAILTCNLDGHTKLLRTVSGTDPIVAVRLLVDGLQKDTAKLFFKYAAGSQLEGQQGYTNSNTGEFELMDSAVDKKIPGPVDDTAGLVRSWSNAPGGAPRGPRSNKRKAPEQLDRSHVAQMETIKDDGVQVQMGMAQNQNGQAQGDILNYD